VCVGSSSSSPVYFGLGRALESEKRDPVTAMVPVVVCLA